jgi:hypothetical protein
MNGHVAEPELEVDQDHLVRFFEVVYMHADPGTFVHPAPATRIFLAGISCTDLSLR